MADLPFFLVDAFTERPFAGNPAVVIPLPAWRESEWHQDVAREMNQSETAYVVKNAQGFDLRWFTPKVEVDLCGHATLASAHVLWEIGCASRASAIQLSTRSGVLTASHRGEEIELDFPLTPEEAAPPPENLLAALGVAAKYVGKSHRDHLVEVESEDVLRRMSPDFRLLANVSCWAVIVTAKSADPQFDFVSRFFAPSAGINEDPVTGSAHCCLADFWRKKLGKSEFLAYQASARGGVVRVRVDGDRVLLGGRAVTVASGQLA